MNKSHINTHLRTEETWNAYQVEPKRTEENCFLCDIEVIECFKHWYICENQFPYDAVAEKHHMLVPLDHVQHEDHLSESAKYEFQLIMRRLNDQETYDSFMRNFSVGQSHRSHLHYHLIAWKRK